DEVEAKKQFQLFCLHAFVQSEESAVASSLLDAFEQGDQELLETTVHRQIITFLDNDIAKLARGLQVPGGISQRPPQKLPLESLGLNNKVIHTHGQQQNTTYDQKENDLVDNRGESLPEFNENNNGQQNFSNDDDIYDSY
ncbi:12163_t:CDS:2, partial [Acaulospora colombiana]